MVVLGAPLTSKDRLLTRAGKTLRVRAGTQCSLPPPHWVSLVPNPLLASTLTPTSLTILLMVDICFVRQHSILCMYPCVRAGSLFLHRTVCVFIQPLLKNKRKNLYSCTISVSAFVCFSFVFYSHTVLLKFSCLFERIVS